MVKPITGKTHVGERRENRPNGDIYVYERITAYNEKIRKTYTVSQKLKGKARQGPKILSRLVLKTVKALEALSMQHVGTQASPTSWNGLVESPASMMIYVLHSARVMWRRCFLSHATG